MGKQDILYKLHNSSIKDDYSQLMLGFENYLMFFDNKDLLFYKNFLDSYNNVQEYKNFYLNDQRRNFFPYSEIPEHLEKVSLFKSNLFVNQIIEYNKAFIAVCDGVINKIIAYKDNDDVYVNFTKLDNNDENTKKVIVNREELEFYYKTGFLKFYDDRQYVKKYIFSKSGNFFNNDIVKDEELLKIVKDESLEYIENCSSISDIVYVNLLKAINDLTDVAPIIFIVNHYMIKFSVYNEPVIDNFMIKYLAHDKYEVSISNIPITIDKLEIIKEKYNLAKTKYFKTPNIDVRLNPEVSSEQIISEKKKFLSKKLY